MRIPALLIVALAGAVLARLNSDQWVALDLGVVRLREVPVAYVAFGGMLVGMAATLLAGLYSDLRVRRLLREERASSRMPVAAERESPLD